MAGTLWGIGVLHGCASSLPPAETGGVPSEFACQSSMPYFIKGQATGFSECKGSGLRHRVHATVCPTFLPRSTAEVKQAIALDAGKSGEFECQSDEDCKRKLNGQCLARKATGGSFCSYGCRADADCAVDELCLCGDPIGHCVPALCRADEDCADGAVCGEYVPRVDCNGSAYACQTPEDECIRKSCWSSKADAAEFCTLDDNRRRICSKDVQCPER
jgi:hypothetical protein